MSIVTIILMSISFLLTILTLILLFKFPSFYRRVLISANIDTVSMMFFMVATFFMAPSIEFILKTVLVLILALITSPLSAHATARSAFSSGYRPTDRKKRL